MHSSEIRSAFLTFFEQKGHLVLPSSSLIPEDRTMLLTTAGMVQFKPYFLGLAQPPRTRITTVQKCARTSDIEEVGRTARHLTFFEMLGNFSFGDYYKREAIAWALEFLFEWMKLDPDRIWVTIYKDDDEAFDIWSQEMGFPAARIVRLGEEDNFWQAGPVGPCGPCSELIYDRGPEFGCGKDTCAPGCDCDRFLEIWNLVFMQYERDEEGNLTPLPRRNIDTGMGLERITMIKQGVNNVFETDLLFPLIEKACAFAHVAYGENTETDISLKVIADHARSATFLIADGVLPSNEGRGYVLRRLIRRAVRYGRLLGIDGAFLAHLSDDVIERYRTQYPELAENAALVREIVTTEEERFLKTLTQGVNLLEARLAEIEARGDRSRIVPGDVVFELYDTYGFPPELTFEIARERGIEVDLDDFERLVEERRETSRKSWTTVEFDYGKEAYERLASRGISSRFVGYEKDETDTEIVALLSGGDEVASLAPGEEGEIVLAETPFYAEGGGQVSDTGLLTGDSFAFRVEHVHAPVVGIIVHRGKVEEGTVTAGASVHAAIDVMKRRLTERNHTSTHLLQWALRLVLGEHVKQAGSSVSAERLRFDFPFNRPLTDEEIDKVERLVNEKIVQDHPVRKYETTLEHAREIGAIALFGEKYREFVRVVEVGDFSRELCGGTHISRTSQINVFKIVSERGIGSGLRRIEAVTSRAAIDVLFEQDRMLKEMARTLKTTPDLVTRRVDELVAQTKELQRQLEEARRHGGRSVLDELLTRAEHVGDVTLVAGIVKANAIEDLRALIDEMRSRYSDFAAAVAGEIDGRPRLVIGISRSLTARGLDAGSIVKDVASAINGGGGGSPILAEAGGKDASGLPAALDAFRNIVKTTLGGGAPGEDA